MQKIKVTGLVNGKLIRDGKVVHKFSGKNLVVNTGRNFIASRLLGTAMDVMSHMAIGSSAIATTKTQTALQGTEHQRKTVTATAVGEIYTVSAVFGSGLASAKQVSEFGIFNNSVGGTMLARFTTPEFTITPGDSLEVQWAIQFGE